MKLLEPSSLINLLLAGHRNRSPVIYAGARKPIRISHESIYRFIYAQIYTYKGLPLASLSASSQKSSVVGEDVEAASPVKTIQDRVSIHQRPPDVGSRKSLGHWEADLMLFANL